MQGASWDTWDTPQPHMMCTVCPSDAYPVPRTEQVRALILCAAAQSSNPHRVQPQPHTYPQVPQPTLLGARESDETTLPLLNRAILRSFVHVKPHGPCSGFGTDRVREDAEMQVCQLDECKSMHVGQSKRVIGRALCGLVAWWSLGCLVPITDSRIQPQPQPPLQLRIPRRRQVGTRGQFFPVLRFNMDAHLQGAAALHAPLSYKQHMDLISLILGCRRVIMFLCASRLPSFAPGHRPSHASRNQVTAGMFDSTRSSQELRQMCIDGAVAVRSGAIS